MTKPIPISSSAEGLFPIRTVSDLTGINAITLRAWERRYGLIEPVRTDSGHRLYRQQDIDRINRVVGLLDRGMRIGQVKARLEAERPAADEASPGADAWRRYREHMLASIIRFDEAGLDETYGEALATHPLEEVTERLLTPLLIELGERWESGRGTVAEEHFFGCYLRNKLGARFHHRSRNTTGPRLLLACLPGERHETGLLLFALAANDAGFHTIMLGADMPLEELPAAVTKTECAAVVLSGLMRSPQDVLAGKMPELVEAIDVPVFLGGPLSATAHDDLRRAGVTTLGSNVQKGIAQLAAVLARGE